MKRPSSNRQHRRCFRLHVHLLLRCKPAVMPACCPKLLGSRIIAAWLYSGRFFFKVSAVNGVGGSGEGAPDPSLEARNPQHAAACCRQRPIQTPLASTACPLRQHQRYACKPTGATRCTTITSRSSVCAGTGPDNHRLLADHRFVSSTKWGPQTDTATYLSCRLRYQPTAGQLNNAQHTGWRILVVGCAFCAWDCQLVQHGHCSGG